MSQDSRHHRSRSRRPRRRRACARARHDAGRAGGRARRRPRRAPVAARAAVFAVGIQRRQGRGAAAGADRLEFAGPAVYPTGAELLEQYLEPLATRTALHDVIRTNSRVTAVGRAGFDKAKTQGARGRAVRDPLSERQGSGDAARRRRDRRVRHVGLAQSGRRRRPAGDRRARGAGADLLRHARCPREGTRALRRQDRRRAGRRALGHRHADRPDHACASRRRAPSVDLAAARQRSRQGLRRRRQRQARRPAANSARTSPRSSHPDRCRSRPAFRVAHISQPTDELRVATGSGCCGRSVVVDELVVATGFRPDLRFPERNSAAARSRDRSARRAGAADRSERAFLRHGAPARRARTGPGRSRLLSRRHQESTAARRPS